MQNVYPPTHVSYKNPRHLALSGGRRTFTLTAPHTSSSYMSFPATETLIRALALCNLPPLRPHISLRTLP